MKEKESLLATPSEIYRLHKEVGGRYPDLT
jgi:hypothetical protein